MTSHTTSRRDAAETAAFIRSLHPKLNSDAAALLRQRRRRRWVLAGGMAVFFAGLVVLLAAWLLRATPQPSASFAVPDSSYAIPAGALFVAPDGAANAPGTQSRPLATLAQALAKAHPGGSIVLRGGTYAQPTLTVRKKITIQAYPHETVWLSGSTPVTTWQREGAVWRHTGWTARSCGAACPDTLVDPAYPAAALPDQLFARGIPLGQVTSKAQVGPGTFYIDTQTRTLYVGSSPDDDSIEASTSGVALQFAPTAGGSTVRGIGVTRYAPTGNDAEPAAVVANADALTFERDTFAQNAGTALDISQPNAIVRSSIITASGQRGVWLHGAHHAIVDDTVIDQNNTEHFRAASCTTSCSLGGLTATDSDSLQLTHNQVRDNVGAGLACSHGCTNAVITGNTIASNQGSGVYYGAGSGADITNNTVAGNGHGLTVANADTVRITHNTLSRNAAPVSLRGNSALVFQNNLLANNNGSASPLLDVQAPAQATAASTFRAFDHNAWYRASANTPATLVRWCAADGCSDFATIAAFTLATGLDQQHSQLDNLPSPFQNERAGNYRLQTSIVPGNIGATQPAPPAHTAGQPLRIRVSAPGSKAKLSGITPLLATVAGPATRVSFFVDNQPVGSAHAAPFLVSWGSLDIPDGRHTLTAKAYAADGTTASSQPIQILTSNQIKTGTLFAYDKAKLPDANGLVADNGVAFMHTAADSSLFAVNNRTGATFATFAVPALQGSNWQGLARGLDDQNQPALFFGDIADPSQSRTDIRIIRVSQPTADQTTYNVQARTTTPTVWHVRYPDGPHDAAAIAVQPGTNRVFIITKNAGNSTMYQMPDHPSPSGINTLRLVGTVSQANVTAAAFSSSGDRLVIRNYTDAIMYNIPMGDLTAALATPPVRFTLPAQPQGEAIAFGPGDHNLLLASQPPDTRVLSMPAPASPTHGASAVAVPPDQTASTPKLTLVSPASDSKVSGDVYVVANAADPAGIQQVVFKINNHVVGRSITQPYVFAWPSAATADGAYTLTAIATNNAGKYTTASVRLVARNAGSSVSSSPGGILSFAPTDDATITQSTPTRTDPANPQLLAGANPRRDFLLKFTVTGTKGRKIASAKLQLQAAAWGDAGASIAATRSSSWSQATVTWGNAPAAKQPALATLNALIAGNTYLADVSQLVKGDGTYSLRVSLPRNAPVAIASRESPTPPLLFVLFK